jgi:hypothetical protein
VTVLIVGAVAAVGLAGVLGERWAARRLHRIRRARYRGFPR